MVFRPYLQKAGIHSKAALAERGSGFGLKQWFFDTIMQDPNQQFGPHQEITGIIQHTSNISDWKSIAPNNTY